MTVVSSLPTTTHRPAGGGGAAAAAAVPFMSSDAFKARLFLAVACFWPIIVLAMYAASAPQIVKDDIRLKIQQNSPRELLLDKKNEFNKDLRFNFRNILDRVDVMGYGPTHPRLAVVIVGDDNHDILSSVKSLFSYV